MKKFLLSILSILAVALTSHAAVQVNVTPAPGEVTEIPQTITVTTDKNVMFVTMNNIGKITFTDAAGNSYSPSHDCPQFSEGNPGVNTFTITLNSAYTAAGTYKLEFAVNSLSDSYMTNLSSKQTFTWTIAEGGSTEPETPELDPNAVNFIGTTPEQGVVSELPAVIYLHADQDLYFSNYKFADKVKLTDANGTSYAISGITSDDGDKIYDNFKITLTDGAITTPGTYTLWMAATTLRDNATMSKGNKETTFTWTVEGSSEPETPTAVNILNVTPAEGTVEELSSILVEVDQPIVMHPMADFSLVDQDGTYYLPTRELVDPDGDGVIKHAKFTFESPITAAGTYTFSMSANALANMEMQIGTPATTYTYTIEEKVEEPSIAITSIEPAEGVVTEIPATIKIVTDSKNLNDITAHRVQNWMSLTDDKGNTYAMTGKTTNSYTSVTLTLTNGAITAPGTYTLTLKDEAITEYGNAAMHTNPATFTWTIEEAAPAEPVVTMTPAEGETVDALSKVIVTCDQGIAVVEKYLAYCAVFGSTSTTQFTSYNQVDANTVELVLANEITDGGEYEISIYTGALTLAPNATAQAYPANTLKYKVNVSGALAVKLEVTPANESTLETVQHFSVTFAKGIMVHPEPTELPFLGYTDPTTGASEQIELTVGATTETSVTLSTAAEQTKAGYYTLVIPAGFFVLENMYLNEYIMCQYNVTGKEEPGPGSDYIQILRVDPAEGTVTEIPYTIYLYTDTDLGSTLFSEMSLTDANGNEYGFHSSGNNDSDDNGSYDRAWVKLADMQPITAPGTYTLTVKPGALGEYNNLSKTNEEVSFTWTIEGGETPDPAETFDLVSVPEAGEVPLLPSKLYVYAGEEIVNADPYDLSKITLTDANGNNYVQSAGAVDYDGDAKYDGLYIRIASGNTNITTAGTYTLNIAEGLVTLKESGKVNKEAAFTWTVTGETPVIEFIKVDPAEGVVEEIPTTITVYTDTDLDMPDKSLMSLTDANGNSYEITGTNWGVDVFGTGFIYLAEAITAPGTYTLTLQAGALQEYYGTKVNEEKSFTWTIEAAAPEYIQIVKTVPEVGVVSEIPTTIGIYTDTDLVGASYSKMSLKDANGTEYQFAESGVTDPQGDGFYECAYVMLAKAITDPGTYTLTVEEGAITQYNGPKVNEAFSLTWTIEGGQDPQPSTDYVFNADEYEVGSEYTTLEDGIYTFLQGEGSTKTWIVDENSKDFSNLYGFTKRIKPQTDKNYITADVPAAGKLVFGVISSSSSDNSRTLSVVQNGTELYGQVVCDANDKVDGVYNVHEVAVEEGLATITMNGALNFYFIEFVESSEPAGDFFDLVSVPEAGEVPLLPSKLYVYAGEEIVNADPYDLSKITLTDDNGNNYVQSAGAVDYDGDAKYDGLYIRIASGNNNITTAGNYTLTIAEGLVTLKESGKVNKEAAFTWTVTGETPVIKFNKIDPEEGVVEEIPTTITVYTDTDLDMPDTSLMSLTDEKGNSYDIVGSYWGVDVFGTGFIYLAEAITAPGTYTLTLQAGALQEYYGTKVNEEKSFTWTIEGNDEPELDPDHINFLSVDPAEGTVAELPAEIWVKTDTDLYIGTSNSAQNKFHLTDANGNTYAVTAVSKDNDGNYTYESVKVTLADGAITAPGTYTLTFDEGALKDYNDRTFINLAKSFTWTIEDTSAELIQVLSVDPAEGVVEVLPRTIDIFTDTDLVAATVSQMTMKDASGNEYAVMEATPGDSDQNGSYDRLRISLAQEITTPGTYTLTIPAGTIQEMGGNRTNAELTFTWTVATVEYIEVYSIDPAEGNRTSLPALISIYTNADIISVAESKVNLVDDKGNNHALKITTKDTDYNETAETVEFELVNGAISTQGTYTLTIEKGAMVDYSDPNLTNNTLVFVWEVEGTGIAGIEAGADGYVVYDLNGYLVMQTRDAADLRQLERGFYIINGKKVVLNK